jgi:hypothetical protein
VWKRRKSETTIGTRTGSAKNHKLHNGLQGKLECSRFDPLSPVLRSRLQQANLSTRRLLCPKFEKRRQVEKERLVVVGEGGLSGDEVGEEGDRLFTG